MKNATFFLGLTTSLFLAGGVMAQDSDALSIAMLIPGKIDDNGFMEAGYNGLLRIEKEFGAKIAYRDQVTPKPEELAEALRDLAKTGPDMVIAHGGQANQAAETVAAEFPEIPFVVVQGNVTGPNLSSYEVLQEDSAWLAGAMAGLMTKSSVVGHISGIRVPPGLKGRGGFYNGLMHTKPDATFLTTFAGNQDDVALAGRAAQAEIDGGADIIFTMLNAGRQGASDAMRAAKVRQIGNVIDWTTVDPEVYVASALADVSIPSVEAVRDLKDGNWKPETVKHIGLANAEAVSLSYAPDVPAEIKDQIAKLREQIISGEIKVETSYDGPEITVE